MTSVGAISVDFDGNSSKLEAAQEKVRKALGGTSAAADALGRSIGRAAGYGDVLDRAGRKIASGADAASTALNRLTPAAQAAQSKLASLQASAQSAAPKLSATAAAVSGVSAAMGTVGGKIGGIVQGLAAYAMAFAVGGPLIAGIVGLGVVLSTVIGYFGELDAAAKDASDKAAAHIRTLKDEVKSLADELRRLKVGVDRAALEVQGAKVESAAAAAAPALARVGGREKFDRLVTYERGGVDLDPIMALTKEEWTALKVAVNDFDVEVDKLALVIARQAEEKEQRDEGFVVDQANLAEARLQTERSTAKTAATADADRVAEVNGANESRTRDSVSAVGVDSTAMAALGFGAAAFVLGALARDAPGIERAATDAAEKELADEIYKEIDGLADAHGARNELIGAQEDLAARLKATEVSATDVIGSTLGGATGTSASGAASFVGSAIGGAGVGAIASAVVDGIEQAMAKALDGIAKIVGDDRVASALGGIDTQMLVIGTLMGVMTFGISAIVVFGLAAMQVAGSLAQNTESFKRFQGAMTIVVDRLISALEPLFQGMLWAVGVFDVLADVMLPFIDAFAGSDIGELLFGAVQPVIVSLSTLALVVGVVVNTLLGLAAYGVGLIPGQAAKAEKLLAMQIDTDALGAARERAMAMTYASATADGEAAAAAFDLADALDGASTNIPTGYRVPFYEAEASDGQGNGGASRIRANTMTITGPVYVTAKSADLMGEIRANVMRSRGRNQNRSGGSDDTN